MDKMSYTSAGLFPWKILKHPELLEAMRNKQQIIPIHAQFIPTNRCNMNCPMCSCGGRDKKLEMSLADANTVIEQLGRLGCRAATITGGGEPLVHHDFPHMVEMFAKQGIKTGLTTNGLLLPSTSSQTLRKLTWCRISNDDAREMTIEYVEKLSEAVRSAPAVDWAFSHVVSETPNFEEIARIVTFANFNKFTHVRLVSDLFMVEDIDLIEVRGYLRAKGIPDDLVIYQGRKDYLQGGDCRIGYLKPLIGPDCKVYACCGVQYALATPSYDLPGELCIGDALKLTDMYKGPVKVLDGRICKKCYYMGYNNALAKLLRSLDHEEFV